MNILTAFLEGLARVSLQGAVLVLLVLLAQRLLARQLAPRWRCALWLVVMARLILPVSVSSVASVFNMMPRLESKKVVIPASFEGVKSALGESGLLEVNRFEPHSDPAPMPDFVARPKTLSKPMMPWPAMLFALWLAGAGVLASYVALGSWRMNRRFSSLRPSTDPGLLALLEQCCQAHGVQSRLSLAESPDVTTPALYGFFHPKLLLPPGFAARFSAGEMRFILLHETAHVKRWDIAFNCLATFLQIFHWFNPLVWLGFARWRADREVACDAMALDAAGPTQNREYGQTILRLLEGFTQRAAVPGLVGILEDKRQLRRRIAMIADYVPRRKWQILALTLLAVLAITGLTDAQNKSARPEKSTETKTSASSRPVVTDGPEMKVTVVDAQTGQPVPDAQVLAPNQAAFWGGAANSSFWTTDTNGVARIHLGKQAGGHLQEITWFTVSVRHKGYAPRGFSWSAENKDVRPDMPGELAVRLERGVTAGGVVRDERGAPVAGVQVQVHGTGYWGGLRHEYSEFWSDSPDSAPLTTDAQGRWEVRDFPKDVEYLVITLSWPGGAEQKFRASPPASGADPFKVQNPGEPFDVADLRADKLVLTLKGGMTVQGVVLDPAGHPLAGVPLKAGFGNVNKTRLADIQTDDAGRFEFRHVLHRQLIVTACPRDFSVTSLIIDVDQSGTNATLRVDSLQPLRIKAEDGHGHPVAGADVSMDWFRVEGQLLDFSAKTGQDGTVVWTNAPISAFAIRAVSPDGGASQKIRLDPGQREITFQLRPGINQELLVTARAHDAATGKAVQLNSLLFQTADREGFRGDYETQPPALRLAISAAKFRPGGMYPEFQLEARADGYATFFSPWRDFDEGDWFPDFAMEPISSSSHIVLLPDGSPAAGARVWTRLGDGFGEPAVQIRADSNGSFALPSLEDTESVVLKDGQNVLRTTVGEIKRQRAVRLEPYGRIQGVLKIAGQPRQGVALNITPISWGQPKTFQLMYQSIFATTAADGGFVFPNVPAGDYILYRCRLRREGGPLTEEHQTPVTVKAGQTATVDYSNRGRQVIGQALPENPNLTVDWLNDDHTLTLKQPPVQSPPVDNLDYARASDLQAAYNRGQNSPEDLRQRREARTYLLQFDQDGSFHADDVPGGAYVLRIHVTKPKPGHNRNWSPFPNPDDDLGMLERVVVVPPGDGPLDLGKLTVKIKDTGLPEKAPAADFAGRTLDGHSVSLSQYRGKYLVLTFWAAWSDRCAERLETVRQLEEQLSRDDRIAFLGVSLDEDPDTVRQAVQSRGYKWTQAQLDSAGLAKAAGNFDVSSLPAIYLIDTKGRIAASNLEGERLLATVQRELKH